MRIITRKYAASLSLALLLGQPVLAQGNGQGAAAAHIFNGAPVPGVANGHVVSAIEGEFNPRGLALGARSLNLSVPGRQNVKLVLNKHEQRGNGNALWRGQVQGEDDSEAVLTVKHNLLFGRVRSGQKVYELHSRANGKLRVEELDLDSLPGCGTDEEHVHIGTASGDLASQGEGAPAVASEGSVEIDLLVVYSHDALSRRGGDPLAMDAFIQSAVDAANAAFTNSQMDARYRLVHTALINHNTQGSTGNDLSFIHNDANGSDSLGVLALRNQYGADMVHLLVDTASSCGTAYVQRSPSAGFEDWAYAVTDVDCAVGNLTFAHEHGHNLGMEHNPGNSSANSSSASYPHSFGHWVNGSYRTVMSYSSPCAQGCSRTTLYSDPATNHNGQPSGISGERHNALTGDLTGPITAGFRAQVVGDDLLVNPGFEQNFQGWTDQGNSAIDTSEVRSGAQSARINSGAGGISQSVAALVPNTDYTLCAWGQTFSFGGTADIGVSIFDAGNSLIDSHAWRVDWSSWQRNSLSFNYPANGDRAEVWVATDATDAPTFADDFTLSEGIGCSEGNLPPTAEFYFTTANLVANLLNYSFDAEGTIVSYQWDLGDNNSSTERDPVHTYAEGGDYEVTLAVTDDGGFTDSITKTVSITGPGGPPSPNPMGFATAPHVDPAYPDNSVVTMVATVATDVDGGIEYKFDCVEAPDIGQRNGCEDSRWQYSTRYSDADLQVGRTYNYRVKARDSQAEETQWSAPVSITIPAVPNQAPTANFSSSSTELDATFTDTSSDSDGSISAWSWTFGDGASSSLRHPQHSYASAGNYTVSLTVTDDDGDSGSITKQLTVTAPPLNQAPTASFTSSADELTVNFTDTSSDSDGSIASRTWNFGDGNGSSATNPSHSFAAAGTYTVSLTVTDNDGESASTSQAITVSEPPPPTTLHVGDLSASGTSKRRWVATIVVTAHTNEGAAAPGVSVSGSWSNGASGSASCTTAGDGRCSVSVQTRSNAVTFNVNQLSNGTDAYQPGDNHDLDYNSNGHAITVNKGGSIDPPPGGNTAPSAYNDNASTEKDTAVTVNALNNDSDADGDSLSITAVGNASNGNTSHNGSVITYTPDNGFMGTDSFSYTISDGQGGSDTAQVTVSVTGSEPPASGTVHLAAMSGSAAAGSRNRWSATVSIAVHGGDHAAGSGVSISGTWSSGGGGSCTTNSSGSCTITKNNLKDRESSTTFSVTGLSKANSSYAPADNETQAQETVARP